MKDIWCYIYDKALSIIDDHPCCVAFGLSSNCHRQEIVGSIHNKSNPNRKDLDNTEFFATSGFCKSKDTRALQNKKQTQKHQDK